MNAKKIMGAVLVALLAAALFVGAGAAAYNDGVVFVSETSNGLGTGTITLTNEDGKTILSVGEVITGEGIEEGIYEIMTGTYAGKFVNVMYPDAKISATVGGASVIGGIVPYGITPSFGVTSYNKGVTTNAILYTNPDGVKVSQFNPNLAGEWKLQADFSAVSKLNGDYKYGKTVYTFTVINTDPAITVSADTVVKGNTFIVTITGYPSNSVTLSGDAAVKLVPNQVVTGLPATGDLGTSISLSIPASGKLEIALFSNVDDKYTITADIAGEKVTAKITVIEGEITAEADADFYYLGNDVVLSGTNTESPNVYFYIKGSNIPLKELGIPQITAPVVSDKTWEAEVDGTVFNNFDAGTYTVYAVATPITSTDLAAEKLSEYTYAPVSLVLKQPFLTAQLSATVVAQESKLTVTGTAEAADKVKYYIFGNNKFASGFLSVDDDGTFEKEIPITAADFATGQYFVVIQHPMYDTFFNIGPLYYNVSSGDYDSTTPLANPQQVGNKAEAEIVLNTTASYDSVKPAAKGNVLFNTLERQSSNAAEALCQALDTQNIDDLYVKATFVVAQPTATINPVDDVAKGAKLVVSGTSNMAPGTLVTVEMLSTAFAAIPKESVNSASFITLTTKVQEDGTWEVEFDTTGLNVDEYTIGATVDSIKTPTVVVKVLESAPVTPEQPDTPVTPEQPTDKPEQPTEPETPGFGALAALAGLGAVAVLLLRRE